MCIRPGKNVDSLTLADPVLLASPRFLQPGSRFRLCPRQGGGLRRQEGQRGVRGAGLVVSRVLGGSGSSGTRTCLEAA